MSSEPVNVATVLRLAEKVSLQPLGEGEGGVILRLGLLWGSGTGNDAPSQRYGATLHVEDAGRALHAAMNIPSGVCNVVGDGERIANGRFKAATDWQPRF